MRTKIRHRAPLLCASILYVAGDPQITQVATSRGRGSKRRNLRSKLSRPRVAPSRGRGSKHPSNRVVRGPREARGAVASPLHGGVGLTRAPYQPCWLSSARYINHRGLCGHAKAQPARNGDSKAGRISGDKDETGAYSLDPAEVHRVFPLVTERDRLNGVAVGRDETPSPDIELQVAHAKLEAENAALKAMLEDMRVERDRWHAQAERLALVAPVTPPVTPAPEPPPRAVSVPTVIVSRRGWSWPWRRAG